MLETLPNRPLTGDEFDSLDESESVTRTFPFTEIGNARVRMVFQFALDLDGEYVGVHFDTDAERWRAVARTSSIEAVSSALANARRSHR